MDLLCTTFMDLFELDLKLNGTSLLGPALNHVYILFLDGWIL